VEQWFLRVGAPSLQPLDARLATMKVMLEYKNELALLSSRCEDKRAAASTVVDSAALRYWCHGECPQASTHHALVVQFPIVCSEVSHCDELCVVRDRLQRALPRVTSSTTAAQSSPKQGRTSSQVRLWIRMDTADSDLLAYLSACAWHCTVY
jgi:hypothetical protein